VRVPRGARSSSLPASWVVERPVVRRVARGRRRERVVRLRTRVGVPATEPAEQRPPPTAVV